MNGCLLFALMIYLLYCHLKKRLQGELRKTYFADVLQCLGSRDYLFRELRCESQGESLTTEILRDEIRSGRMSFDAIAHCKGLAEEVGRLHEDSQRLLFSFAAHLLFVFLVPLGFRMLITQKLWFDRGDFGEILLAFLLASAVFYIMQKEWPVSGLQTHMSSYLKAWLGSDIPQLFAADLKKIQDKAWQEGLNEAEERHHYLKAWHLSQLAVFKARLAWFENALGPLELIASCVFTILLVGLPLLSHFSQLLDH